jgi:hypothetical protein
VPLVARVPLQPPEAVHVVAFSELQLRMEDSPFDTVVSEADRVTAGAGAVTTTSADCAVEPPGPVHVSV